MYLLKRQAKRYLSDKFNENRMYKYKKVIRSAGPFRSSVEHPARNPLFEGAGSSPILIITTISE